LDKVEIEIQDVVAGVMGSVTRILGVLDVGDVKNFPLALTSSISDLRDITTRSGSFAVTFKVPSTKDNDDLLEHIYLAEQKNYKDFDAEKPCVIRVNDVDIHRGRLQITKINSLGRDGSVSYSFKFFGSNMDWVLKMKGYKTADLAYLNKSLTYGDTEVQASWQDVGGNELPCYSFINRGERLDPTTVNVGDLRPDYFLLDYLEAAFLLVGYNFESTFFNTAASKQLIIPFFGKNFKIEQATIDANFVDVTNAALHSNVDTTVPNRANGWVYKLKMPLINTCTTTNTLSIWSQCGASSTTGSYTENSDAGNNFASGVFVAPVDGFYKVSGFFETLQYFNSTPEQSAGQLTRWINHFVTINGNNATSYLMNTLSSSIVTQANPLLLRETWTKDSNNIFLSAGDTLRVDMEATLWNTGAVTTGLLKADVEHAASSSYTIELQADMQEGDTYNWADKSDTVVDVFDIIMDVFRIFNCYLRVNEATRTIYAEPRDDFYNALSTATNKTDDIDDNIQIDLQYNSKTYKKNHLFQYAKDSNDKFLAARNKEADYEWLSYEHTYPDKFKDGVTNYKTKVIASTYIIEDLNFTGSTSGGGNTLGAYTSRMWNDADTMPIHSDDFAPRILYHAYGYQRNSTLTRSHILDYRGTQILQYGYALPYTIVANYSGSTGYAAVAGCLSFEDVDSSYSFLDGLWQTHFSKTSKEIEEGKRVKLNMLFDLVDWQSFDFREIIYFDNRYPELEGYWRYERINGFKPVGNAISTSFDLIQARTYPTEASGREGVLVPDGARLGLPDGGGNRTGTTDNRTIISGNDNYAARNGNHLVGHNLRATGQNQLIMGMYNSDSSSDISTDLFQLGTGTESNPNTLIRVDENGTIYFNGSEVPNSNGDGLVVDISTDTTADVFVQTYLVDTSAGDVNVYLPFTPPIGKSWNIKKMVAANNMVVWGSADTSVDIEGASSATEGTQYVSLRPEYDGTEFNLI
jgi:hypothetical protein